MSKNARLGLALKNHLSHVNSQDWTNTKPKKKFYPLYAVLAAVLCIGMAIGTYL